MDSDEKLQTAIDYLAGSGAVDAVYLFGSRTGGSARPDSDHDIAVLFEPGKVPDLEQQLDLRISLGEILHGDVDLVVLNEVGPIIAMQAVSKGRVLFEGNRSRHLNYVTRLYSSYAEFKELRAPMEKDILKRKFYGR